MRAGDPGAIHEEPAVATAAGAAKGARSGLLRSLRTPGPATSDARADSVAPELKEENQRLAALRKQLADVKPVTTPIMKELPEKQQRPTHVLIRGNFLDKGQEVDPGAPGRNPKFPIPPAELPARRWASSRAAWVSFCCFRQR